MDDEHDLERLISYVNRKNTEYNRVVITPKEVIEYYREQKLSEFTKAFCRTLTYIDDKLKGG